jgi:hypothetical protein
MARTLVNGPQKLLKNTRHRPSKESGYFRLSLTIPLASIERALPGFERALRRT